MVLFLVIGQIAMTTVNDTVTLTNIPTMGSIVVDPEPSNEKKYEPWINYYCQIYCIDPELVKLVIQKESQYNANAVSRTGAIGLMQLMPETAKILGVDDPYDPGQNIEGGVRFLHNLFDQFRGNLELTLAAYHAGPGLVSRLNRVPSIPETIEYVDYIVSRYSGATRPEMYFTITDEGVPLLTNCPK